MEAMMVAVIDFSFPHSSLTMAVSNVSWIDGGLSGDLAWNESEVVECCDLYCGPASQPVYLGRAYNVGQDGVGALTWK